MNSNFNSANKVENKRKEDNLEGGKKSARKLLQSSDIQIKLEIQLQEDETAYLIIKGNEDPNISVDKFCKENGLDDEIKQCILDEVDKKIEENLKELEEIDEELHDGSDLSNNQSQDFSNNRHKSEANYDYSNRGEASDRNLTQSREAKPKAKETNNSQKLRNSKQSGSLRNEKVYYDTNNFNNNNNNNLRKKLNEDSNSDKHLSEEISNSEEEINYIKYSNKKKNEKLNTSPHFYSKGDRTLSKNEESDKKNKDSFANSKHLNNNLESLEKERRDKNERNSNRSRNNNNRNRSSNPNEIESHLSSDKNTYYTFNENNNNKRRKENRNQVTPKNNSDTFNSKEFNINQNKNNTIKKGVQRYEESEERNLSNSEDDYKPNFNVENNKKSKKENNKEIKGNDSKNIKSKHSRSKDSSNSRGNSQVIVRKSIKFAAYEESFSVSESERNSQKQQNLKENNYSDEDSLEDNRGPRYKYKKDAHVFERAEIIDPDDSQEEGLDEENEKEKGPKENKYSNMENVYKKNKKEFDYHQKKFNNMGTSNIDLKNDLAKELSKIQDRRKNNSIEESDIIENKTNFYNNESEESNALNMKAYYESNFNQNSLIGYEDINSQKNNNRQLNNLNIMKNKNLKNKASNHDYLNLNGKPNLNNKYNQKDKSAERKKWDNSKALAFPLTSDKNKVEYTPPNSLSRSRSVSKSLSNKNMDDINSRTYSDNGLSKEEIEEMKKAKKSYKENFLKTHKISDPDFVPGKRLYEQYQKKQPQKQEHHKQIKQSKLAEEIREATFIPQIDKNSKRIFKRSQEKNRNRDNSFVVSSNTNNNFSSFSNTNFNNVNNFSTVNTENVNINANKKNKSFDRVENRLIDFGKNSKNRLLRERTKNSIQDGNYSFHPTISEKSQIIASIKKKERLEKAKSFILNNTRDDLADNAQFSGNYSDENVSNENEEYSKDDKNNADAKSRRTRKANENDKYTKSKNVNYSSNDSLMNSQENFSNEKSFKNKNNKDNASQISGNTNKIKINPNTNRTIYSNVDSENTFFNMRVQPKNTNRVNKGNNFNNSKNKNFGNNSMRNLSANNRNKSIDKSFSKNKGIRNIMHNAVNSKSKSRSKDKSFSKYIPLNKNTKKNNYFANDSSFANQSKADKDSNFSGDKSHFTSRTPNKFLLSSRSNVDLSSKRFNTNFATSRDKSHERIEPSIHEILYTEADLKSEKRLKKETEIMNKLYPFKPKINEKTKKIINRNETKEQFIKRLMNSKKEAEEIIIAKKRESDLDKDPETGKPLFKPTITRGPLNPGQRKVTVDLEGYYDQLLLEKKKKVHEEEMLNNLQKKKQWLEKSMKSVLKMKIEKYKQIFDLLDSDKDGFISFKNIKLSEVNAEVLEALTPLFDELQKKGNYIDFKEFCIKADEMLAVKIFGTAK